MICLAKQHPRNSWKSDNSRKLYRTYKSYKSYEISGHYHNISLLLCYEIYNLTFVHTYTCSVHVVKITIKSVMILKY